MSYYDWLKKQNASNNLNSADRTISRGNGLLKQGVCIAEIMKDGDWDIPWYVGYPGLPPKYSSSNRATAFSSTGNILSPNQDDRGSMRGAFRHTLWQSDIVPKYSAKIAQRIGDCHERNKPFNPNRTIYRSMDEADAAADQFNNITGRDIGAKFGHLSTKQRAIEILKKAYVDGLYTVEKTPYGNYKVKKTKIDLDTFEKMYIQIQSLDENGLPPIP